MVQALQFTNFRGFEQLTLESLGRVNLVVGKNDSGKTSLLEGIALLAAPRTTFSNLPSLLRPASSGDVVNRYYRWLIRDEKRVSQARLHGFLDDADRVVSVQRRDQAVPLTAQPGLDHIWGSADLAAFVSSQKLDVPFTVVPVRPTTTDDLVRLYSRAVEVRGGEEQMNALFTAIDGRIRKVRITSAPDGIQLLFDFNLREMLPVSQVGQGIHRLIAIYSELIAGRARICVIDEIENGIHHSMLEKVWAGIGAAAEQLGVQVFATTHSYECIEAAHKAFSNDEFAKFAVIQLFRTTERVESRVLQSEQVGAALQGGIDLR